MGLLPRAMQGLRPLARQPFPVVWMPSSNLLPLVRSGLDLSLLPLRLRLF